MSKTEVEGGRQGSHHLAFALVNDSRCKRQIAFAAGERYREIPLVTVERYRARKRQREMERGRERERENGSGKGSKGEGDGESERGRELETERKTERERAGEGGGREGLGGALNFCSD